MEAELTVHTCTRAERKLDRDNKNILVIEFDLENKIALPKADTSSSYYKRKLSCFNETGFVSQSKQGYCMLWAETLMGR